MGVWDTVSSIGLPETWISSALGLTWLRDKWNEKYGYHDVSLPSPRGKLVLISRVLHSTNNPPIHAAEDDWRGYVRRAYQALSLDENRTSFSPILLRFPKQESRDPPENGPAFLQCWFPGVHTDVGGGYERAYRDISDLSFAWMIDMCWPYLSFKNKKIKESLKAVSTERIDEDELSFFGKLALKRKGPSADPQETPWGLSEAHDELHTLAFWAGGSTHRKPSQYYLGKHGTNEEPFETHEYMHASVRMKMLIDKEGLPSKWKPQALAGFKLQCKKGKWFWVKEVGIHVVEIPEWMPEEMACLRHTEEYPLMGDENRKLLGDVKRCEKIEMVPSGWSKKWLWLLLAMPGLAAAAVALQFDSRKHAFLRY